MAAKWHAGVQARVPRWEGPRIGRGQHGWRSARRSDLEAEGGKPGLGYRKYHTGLWHEAPNLESGRAKVGEQRRGERRALGGRQLAALSPVSRPEPL